MQIKRLKQKLIEAARTIPPDERVPNALEAHVMAQITSTTSDSKKEDSVEMWGWKSICLWGSATSAITVLFSLAIVIHTANDFASNYHQPTTNSLLFSDNLLADKINFSTFEIEVLTEKIKWTPRHRQHSGNS